MRVYISVQPTRYSGKRNDMFHN